MRQAPQAPPIKKVYLPKCRIALPLACILFIIQVAAMVLENTMGNCLLQAGLMSVVVLSTAFLGGQDGRFDLRQPWCTLMIVHIPFWIIGTVKVILDAEQQASWINGSYEHIRTAMLMVTLGFLLISCGYRLAMTIRLPRLASRTTPREWDYDWMIVVAVLLYTIVWVVRWQWYETYLVLPFLDVLAMGPPPSYIRTFGTTLPQFLIVACWAAYHYRPSRRMWLLAITLTVGDITWGVIYGVMKSLLFLPVFLPVLPYIVQRAKIPLIRLVFGTFLLLGFIYPYVDAVRDQYFQPNGPFRNDAVANVVHSGYRLFSFSPAHFSAFANKTMNRVTGLGSLTQILQLEEDDALDLNGVFYLRSILGLIPRVLWPEKPVIHEGSYFAAYLDGQRGVDAIDTTTVIGSVAPTLFGSFYWNLGWLGLLGSAFGLGFFSGVAYKALLQWDLSNPGIFLYYAAILNALDTSETEVVKIPSSIVWGLLLAWGANVILSARHKESPTATAHAGTAYVR